MARRSWFIVVAGAACLGLILVTLFLYKGESATNVAVAAPGCDQVASIHTALAGRGFTQDQYRIGLVDWDASEANTRGQAAFTSQTPQSAEEMVAWLGSDTAESNAALKAVLAQSEKPREVVLDKTNWLPVQFITSFQLPGNTGYRSGEVYSSGNRESKSGDVIWFFTTKTNCEIPTTTVRAGCGNPQSELPKPNPAPAPTPTNPLAKGPDRQPAPCVDNAGVRCDGIPGSGGQPGTGGAISHGPDGYSPQDPPPTTIVPAPTPPTSAVTIPPAPPPTTTITAPPG